jgi:hypothetical protein
MKLQDLQGYSVPESLMPQPVRLQTAAERTHAYLGEQVRAFEAGLDDVHEIGAKLVSFGSMVTFHIERVDYLAPDLLTFYGTSDDGERVQLVQHVSQLSVLLVAMKKIGEKPRRIGFIWD